jgi:hypothetical protein
VAPGVSLQTGRIQSRHPIVRDDDEHGIIVKKRIGKLPQLEQEQARIDLEKLVAKKPLLLSPLSALLSILQSKIGAVGHR